MTDRSTIIPEVTQEELESILSAYNNGKQTEEQEERLVWYVYNELYKKNEFEPDSELIAHRMTELVNGYSIRQLVKKGLLDVFIDPSDGEDSYGLSPLGQDVRSVLEVDDVS